jgi:hypothetical protein
MGLNRPSNDLDMGMSGLPYSVRCYFEDLLLLHNIQEDRTGAWLKARGTRGKHVLLIFKFILIANLISLQNIYLKTLRLAP